MFSKYGTEDGTTIDMSYYNTNGTRIPSREGISPIKKKKKVDVERHIENSLQKEYICYLSSIVVSNDFDKRMR